MENFCKTEMRSSCCDCFPNHNLECDKYKEKAEEVYAKAYCIQEEAKRYVCEAQQLEGYICELQFRIKQLCAEANETWNKATQLEAESNELFNLAECYFKKASDCYKSMNNACQTRFNTGTCCKGQGNY